jgi:enoyl-[acyl-carrier protein] reductase III
MNPLSIDLAGKTALVTGSSRGIGRACALRLAEAGADVIVNYLTSREAALEVGREITAMGRRAFVVKADVSEEDDVRAMVDFVGEQTGRLDILVSNAASGGFRPLMDSTARHFQATMNTNVLALVYLVQAALPLLERSPGMAKVIAISSHGSQQVLPLYGLIAGSKGAIESIARHLAAEIGPRGVNVNVLRAGLVETDSTRLVPGVDRLFAAHRARTMIKGRQLTPRDIADSLLFLASPLSDMVQGAVLVVDGGVSVCVG